MECVPGTITLGDGNLSRHRIISKSKVYAGLVGGGISNKDFNDQTYEFT